MSIAVQNMTESQISKDKFITILRLYKDTPFLSKTSLDCFADFH